MNEQRRWPVLPWVPVSAGLLWLVSVSRAGLLAFLAGAPVGAVLLAAGVALLLWPADRRIAQTLALVSLVATPLAGLIAFAVGPGLGLLLLLLSAACFVVAGACAVWQEPHTEGVAKVRPSLRLAALVAIDEAILGGEQLVAGLPSGDETRRLGYELHTARSLFRERGWLTDPATYHREPPPLADPQIRPGHSGRIAYEHVSFESLYEPDPDEPGRERWLARAPNRTGHAWLLRQAGADRPWLVCLHGYRMGTPAVDLRAFARYHQQLGLNVLIPVLPLHGPRRSGRLSGQGFLAGDALDTVHAEAQAMWDIRRLIGWLRAQGASRIGVYGISLGGYTTALLACLQEDLACAIAGIPVVDFARIYWRHGPRLQLDYLEHVGIGVEHFEELFRSISPLAAEPRVPTAGRYIYGALADRLVPPDHVRDLVAHWKPAHAVWYAGGHCSFVLAPHVHETLERVLRERGLAVA